MLVYRQRSLNTNVSIPAVTRDQLPRRIQMFLDMDAKDLDKEIKVDKLVRVSSATDRDASNHHRMLL